MVERVGWLHISDFHVRASGDNWSQDVVLKDLVESIRARADEGQQIDFVLASGDLAFSGKANEYETVVAFFDELLGVLGLSKEALFCVPGNHDVDRDVQKTCHVGARQLLASTVDVDRFLGDAHERESLLQRQTEFRNFESAYFVDVKRKTSSDGLGYVRSIDVRGLQVCVIGLNSAWLCRSGKADQRQILIGDRQLIDLHRIACNADAAIKIAMAHHPPDWLKEFDQSSLEQRLLPECDFYHRGHLHTPQLSVLGGLSGRRCVLIGAGAAYARRDYENSYSTVTLNIEHGMCEVRDFQYANNSGKFDFKGSVQGEIILRGEIPGTPSELAQAIVAELPELEGIENYLAAVLNEITHDVPLEFEEKTYFASRDLLPTSDDGDGKQASIRFLGARNLLKAGQKGVPLVQRLSAVREQVSSYGRWLLAKAEADDGLASELRTREQAFRNLQGKPATDSNAVTLMNELAAEKAWSLLEAVAKRHVGRKDASVARHAERMRAFAVAFADEPERRPEGLADLVTLAQSNKAEVDDLLLACVALSETDSHGEAVELITQGVQRYGGNPKLLEVGYSLALDAGDRKLRDVLDRAKKETS